MPLPPPPKTARISSDRFFEKLVEAGVFTKGEHIRRIVIDAQVGHALVIHVERYGDWRVLDVVASECGTTITEALAAHPIEAPAE